MNNKLLYYSFLKQNKENKLLFNDLCQFPKLAGANPSFDVRQPAGTCFYQRRKEPCLYNVLGALDLRLKITVSAKLRPLNELCQCFKLGNLRLILTQK